MPADIDAQNDWLNNFIKSSGLSLAPGSKTFSSGGLSVSGGGTMPAYDRVTSIPGWLPKERTAELEDEYSKIGERFDTSAYDRENEGQQSRLLTSALNAGNNAATEYTNRARQSGGSGMGAGLVKALASVGARKSAGELGLEKEKFDASQREKAAGLAGQIATTLGTLRDSYLRTIVDYATKSDSTSADYKAKMTAADIESRKVSLMEKEAADKNRGGGYTVDRMGKVSGMYGNPLENNPNFNPATGYLNHGGW